MKISTYFFILTLTFVAYGCNKEKNDEIVDTPRVVPNLIDMYATAVTFKGYFYDIYNGIVVQGDSLQLEDHSENVRKYGDTVFNKPRFVEIEENLVFVNEFTGINVTSNSDFNEIKAGLPLNSKIRLVALSPIKWLKSKGKLTFNWNSAVLPDYAMFRKGIVRDQFFPVNKYLTDVTKEDLTLLSPARQYGIFLLFTEHPAIKDQVLTVYFNETNGVIKASYDAKFK